MPLKKGAIIWDTRDDLTITNFPTYLKEGFFIKNSVEIDENEFMKIEVTGQVTVYVAIDKEPYDDGGYKESLPRHGWEKETGEINVANGVFILSPIFSKSLNKGKEVLLPETTCRANILIIVVSNCPGKSFTFHLSKINHQFENNLLCLLCFS